MAYTDRAWLWTSGDSNTLYVQVNDQTDDQDQVVFKWRNGQAVQAQLRSSREILTDCQLVSVDKTGCVVDIANRRIEFHWEEPSYERPGLIAEGIAGARKPTTWAEKKRQTRRDFWNGQQ
jgi:hypothetical protein